MEKLTFKVKNVDFTMVKVDGGTFTMGATKEQGIDAPYDELPTHQVTLSDYYIGQIEVTQALWLAVMGESVTQIANSKGCSTSGVGANYPMYYISYDDCITFINKLNTLLSSQLGGKRFALPTEAQWEFAARGGNKSKDYKYAGSNKSKEVAWCYFNNSNNTHPVAQKQPNELGLYDMSGNVWEWCKDWYDNYSSNAQTNPQGPKSGTHRVYRGGSWCYSDWSCRLSNRSSSTPDNCNTNIGLRLCLIDSYLECDLQSKIDTMNRFLNGEIIEFRKKIDSEWTITEDPTWNWESNDYRVKVFKYRPFKSIEEFLDAQKKHGIYVKSKKDKQSYSCFINANNGIKLSKHDHVIDFMTLFNDFTFPDDTPCGITE